MTAPIALDTDSPASLEWQAEQHAAATEYLHALPEYAAFRALLETAVQASDVQAQQRRGNLWFQAIKPRPDADHMALVVRHSPTAQPRVLVDFNTARDENGQPIHLGWFSPSPDGRFLAFAYNKAGVEKFSVRILDVATGEMSTPAIPDSQNPQLGCAWLADSSGFIYSTLELREGRVECPIYTYLLDGTLIDEETPANLVYPTMQISADGRYTSIRTGNTLLQASYFREGSGPWRPLLRDIDGITVGEFYGDHFIAVVDGDAPRGRLVSIPVASPADKTTWTELVAESDDVLRTMRIVGDRIVLGYHRDAVAGIRVLDVDGTVVDEVKLPGLGSVESFAAGFISHLFPMFVAGDDEISFLFSTPVSSFGLYRYVVSPSELEELVPPEIRREDLVVRTIHVTSSDGALVPATVVHRKDLDVSIPQPTLIHGYGGFNVGVVPAYRWTYFQWVNAGGIFVLGHLRGGCELGRDWWTNGRRERKQQTFDDVYAIAQHLIDEGATTAGQIALEGGSNGGFMAGACLTQRPDLFAAVVPQVPVLDLLGFHRDPVTWAIIHDEYGDPNNEDDRAWLAKISPRHLLTQGVSYPATLTTAGANDPRCPAWHSRVFTDELRKANSSSKPVLLQVHADQGHGAAALGAQKDQSAEWLAFCAHHTGLHVDEPAH